MSDESGLRWGFPWCEEPQQLNSHTVNAVLPPTALAESGFAFPYVKNGTLINSPGEPVSGALLNGALRALSLISSQVKSATIEEGETVQLPTAAKVFFIIAANDDGCSAFAVSATDVPVVTTLHAGTISIDVSSAKVLSASGPCELLIVDDSARGGLWR